MSPLFEPSFSVATQHVPDFETVGIFQEQKNKVVLDVPMLYILLFIARLAICNSVLKMLLHEII